MAYDPAAKNVVRFGGNGEDNVVYEETWIWNGTTWTQASPAANPPARYRAAMAYDPATGQLLLFGGKTAADGGTLLDDTWSWNGATWTELSPTVSPPALWFTSMAFDPSTDNLVLFGGTAAHGFYGETWTWNGTTWSLASSSGAPARTFAAMAYDPVIEDEVLLGGCCETGGGTWIWNGTTWAEARTAAQSPHELWNPSMTYDAASGEMVLFGGKYPYKSDLVIADSTWTYRVQRAH